RGRLRRRRAGAPGARLHAADLGRRRRSSRGASLSWCAILRPDDGGVKRIDTLLADYGAHHRARGNLVCHAFGVTLIVFGIVALLTPLRIGPVTFAEVAIALLVA